MRRFGLIAVVAVFLAGMEASAQADLLQDVCVKRAENLSGYKPRGLTIGDRRGRLSFSGSVSVGVSTSSGDASTGVFGTGRDSGEDRKQDAKVSAYWKEFDDCMRRQ